MTLTSWPNYNSAVQTQTESGFADALIDSNAAELNVAPSVPFGSV